MELTIEQALQQAVAAHKEGDLQEAERLYRAILQAQPLHPDANHNLGILAVAFNKVDAALPLFKSALEANPSIEQFWLSYIDALIKVQQFDTANDVFEQGKKGGLSGAKVDALGAQLASITQVNETQLAPQKTSQVPPNKRNQTNKNKNKKKAKTKKLKAMAPSQQQLDNLLAHYHNGRYDDAEKLAMSITQEFPTHQFGWKVLAAVFDQLGKKAKAVNANQKSVELSPQDEEAYNNLGVTLRALGRLNEAVASFNQAVTLKPDYAEAHSNLGTTLKELGRFNESESSHIRAITLNSDSAGAHYNLGTTLQGLGRLEEAKASYIQAITLNPEFVEALNNLGNILQELGRFDEAESICRRAITLESDYAAVHNNLANTLQKMGRLEEAEVSCRQAIVLSPGFAEFHSNLGNILQELGMLDKAEASYTQAVALRPDFAEAHFNLGILLFARRQYNLAAKKFELSDNHQSESYAIQCLYLLDMETIFYEKFDLLVNQGEINAVIGSLGIRSEFKYGIKKSNPFCNDPLKYVVNTDLNALYDFENIFVKTARDILKSNSVSYKAQGLLTNGIQTAGNIFVQGKVPKTEIESIIHAEIEKYRIHFKDSEEGFIKSWPTSYEIKGWLVCMQSGGKLAPHMHENGWISGSVYINVPPKSKTDSGNIVLCLSDEEHALGAEQTKQRIIDVVTGSLCLFPSSLHHYTVPFEEKEDRIVLAFDVIPKY